MNSNMSEKPEMETILIVDNDKHGGRYLSTVLCAAGYTVLLASNGTDALNLNYRGRIDLLLSDLIMPEMHGAELAQRMQRLHSDIKIIFMSGFTETAAKSFGFLPDAPFLEKPIVSATLRKKVAMVLSSSLYPAAALAAHCSATALVSQS